MLNGGRDEDGDDAEGDGEDGRGGDATRRLSDCSHPPPHRPGGRLLFRFFLEPNNLTRENTFSLLGFSFAPLLLLGLPLPRHAFAFSRSLACRFWRIRELAIAAARDMFPRRSETRLRVLGWRGRSRTRRSGCVERGERG